MQSMLYRFKVPVLSSKLSGGCRSRAAFSGISAFACGEADIDQIWGKASLRSQYNDSILDDFRMRISPIKSEHILTTLSRACWTRDPADGDDPARINPRRRPVMSTEDCGLHALIPNKARSRCTWDQAAKIACSSAVSAELGPDLRKNIEGGSIGQSCNQMRDIVIHDSVLTSCRWNDTFMSDYYLLRWAQNPFAYSRKEVAPGAKSSLILIPHVSPIPT